jgi:hypothetical protein
VKEGKGGTGQKVGLRPQLIEGIQYEEQIGE